MIKTNDLNILPFSSQIEKTPLHPNIISIRVPKGYLARTFHLDKDYGMRQMQINLKRIHIRKLIEAEKGLNEYIAEYLSTKHKICHKKKLFKRLQYVQLSSLFHLNWIEELKHCKNITHFKCNPYNYSPPKNIIRYMQNISKNVEKISMLLDRDLNLDSSSVIRLYKAAGKLHNLKKYGGFRTSRDREKNPTKSEFLYLNRKLRRLPKLEHFECEINEEGLHGLCNLMSEEGKSYEKVTKLSMDLCFGPLREDDDEITPLFQFQTFPNLKELNFHAKTPQFDELDFHPCYSHIATEGFKKLAHLEKLSLKLSTYSTGLNFIFEGLLHLPQLSSFSFQIDYIGSPQEWDLMIQFLQNQANLVWLDLKIRSLYTTQKPQTLENVIASLSHKPHLRYLTITTYTLSLHSLSDGLDRLVGSDKIKSFRIQAEGKAFECPDPIPSFWGICKFLLRNKSTLSELQIDLPLFKEPELNDSFAGVISQLSNLKKLSLSLSVSSIYEAEPSRSIFSDLNKVQPDKDNAKSWNFRLKDILLKLQKLEDLTLNFEKLEKCPSQQRTCIIECFKVLPSLKHLRNLEFSLPTKGVSLIEANVMNSALKKLSCLNSIKRSNFNEDKVVEEVDNTIDALQCQQSTQTYLYF